VKEEIKMEDNKVLATVAGKEITESDLNREMQLMDEDKKQYMDNPFYREECLSLLIDMHVFEKYGEEIKADEDAEFVKAFENTKRDMLAKYVVSKKLKEISVSDDAKFLKEIRYKKNTALHDVVAYMFVREKRKHDSNKKLLQKASYWFITANKKLCEFNIAKKINGNAPEIILPEELTSLLFLQNPIKYSGKVSSIGLNELIAQTLSEEYPSRDIINEFDEAISTINDITNDDYKILLSSISQESTINIQRLLHTSNSQPAEFNKAIHSIIEKERNNKLETDNKHKAEIQRNKELQKDNESLSKRLSAISQQIANIQEQQRLDKQSEVENKKRNRRNNIMYISIIISLVSIIILQIFPNIIFWLKTCIQAIGGLGGLWGFCNLLLNIYSKFK
jgi:hypothetical protein